MKTKIQTIRKQINASIALKRQLLANPAVLNQLAELATAAADVLGNGGRLLLAGNGGSAADAQHIAGELVGRFMRERGALPALALTTDSSILTALGNDYDFDYIFARQVEAQGRRGDMLLGISTSGNSANVVRALQTARAMGLFTAGLTGQGGGKMAPLCDYCICIPSRDTPRIQESMLLVEHILCGMIEDAIFPVTEKKPGNAGKQRQARAGRRTRNH